MCPWPFPFDVVYSNILSAVILLFFLVAACMRLSSHLYQLIFQIIVQLVVQLDLSAQARGEPRLGRGVLPGLEGICGVLVRPLLVLEHRCLSRALLGDCRNACLRVLLRLRVECIFDAFSLLQSQSLG